MAEAAGLAPYLIMASAEAASGGRKKGAILSGACEALIAALYLDGGMTAARNFVMHYWHDAFAATSEPNCATPRPRFRNGRSRAR